MHREKLGRWAGVAIQNASSKQNVGLLHVETVAHLMLQPRAA
jgi:hypothetical protein